MTTHTSVYQAAELYDLAFSYRDIGAEARFLRELYRRRRGRPAKTFLELAARPARHAIDMRGAGLDVLALDLAPEMAAYGVESAKARGLALDYVVADMTAFEAPRTFDLAACMLCSASYLLTPEAFLAHLRSVRAALAPEGMYFLELTHPSELAGERKSQNAWKMSDARGELSIAWGGDLAKSVDGVWRADVHLHYRPFDGSAPVHIHDEADQRAFSVTELAGFAEQSGFAIEASFGAFDEHIEVDDPRAHRLLLVLRRA